MEIELYESVNLGSCRVDKDAGIIHDVMVLTENGNVKYPRPVRQKAISLLEGSKVNFNHGSKIGRKETLVEDRGGKLLNLRDTDAGVVGDYHYDKSDPRNKKAECFAESKNLADCVGFSIHGKGVVVNGVCEEIISVKSVDLVADPGSVKSLFESKNMEETVDPIVALQAEVKALRDEITALKAAPAPVVESKDENAELQAKIDALTIERDCRELCESLDVKTDDVLLKALTRLDTPEERKSFVTSVKRKMVSQAPRSGSIKPVVESKETTQESEADRLARMANTLRGLR